MMLGDLGADVVKVERPGEGDGSRRWGPPFVGGESAYFMQVNRNKRSIAVDLRDDAGREVVRRLIGRADVLLHNFLPAAALRYEVDWEAVEPRTRWWCTARSRATRPTGRTRSGPGTTS